MKCYSMVEFVLAEGDLNWSYLTTRQRRLNFTPTRIHLFNLYNCTHFSVPLEGIRKDTDISMSIQVKTEI
jgi:hypothetical protein